MNKNNIKRLPYHKTYRRYEQLVQEEAERMLVIGRRKSLLKFLGVMLLMVVGIWAVLTITSLTTSTVLSILGVLL